MDDNTNEDASRAAADGSEPSDDHRGSDGTDQPPLTALPPDPRLRGDFVRRVPATGDGGPVVLVGAVHDHPASEYRAATVVAHVDPAVVALELPPTTVPLYRRYATTPEGADLGGEMAAAIAAAPDARHVGIDAPNRRFLRRLVERLARERPSLRVTARTVRDTLSVSRHALACGLASVAWGYTPFRPRVETPVEHDVAATAAPEAQSTHEADHVSRSMALLRTFDPPRRRELIDSVREACMARSLEELARDGPVVAVVGYDHLADVYARLVDGRNA